MDFFPFEAFDNNQAQKQVWDWIKKAFKDEPGVAYYRYPIFTRTGRLNREPDVLILHRELGLWVIECKGCSISNIESIQGHEWRMSNWYKKSETPVAQAEDEMFAIRNKLTKRKETRNLIFYLNFRVALPKVKQREWESKGFHQLPSTQGVVLTYEELTPEAFKNKLRKNLNNRKQKLTDKEWELVRRVLGGILPSKPPRNLPTGKTANNPLRVVRAIESKLKTLDETQQRVAFEVPNGPQRLRGLAGTGKTVLLAKRAAKIHASHPDWTIAFVFFTQSLYEQVLGLISQYYREMTGEEPDWTKLKVLHAWGGRRRAGFYSTLAKRCGQKPISTDEITRAIGYVNVENQFDYVCQCLADKYSELPVIYDAILIDEGQDLPASFYRLAFQTLTKPKRFYWGYDEAQGIGSLTIPRPKTVFGKTTKNQPVVDLKSSYEGGILKSHKMNKCYRNPRLLLMTAHAVNMGLFRQKSVLQGVTNKRDWKDLGYEVIEGNFRRESVRAGKTVTITRSLESSPHPVDQDDFELNDAVGSSLSLKLFSHECEEQKWIAQQVARDLEQGFDPWDILITGLSCGYNRFDRRYFSELQVALEKQGVNSYIAGMDGNRSIFRKAGYVTISSIFRAKGNEAWKVYACRFHYATRPRQQKSELHKRNEAFVALTRARVWCVATGLDDPIFNELQRAIDQYPNFTFPAFNKESLKRLTEDEDNGDDQVLDPSWRSRCPDWLSTC